MLLISRIGKDINYCLFFFIHLSWHCWSSLSCGSFVSTVVKLSDGYMPRPACWCRINWWNSGMSLIISSIPYATVWSHMILIFIFTLPTVLCWRSFIYPQNRADGIMKEWWRAVFSKYTITVRISFTRYWRRWERLGRVSLFPMGLLWKKYIANIISRFPGKLFRFIQAGRLPVWHFRHATYRMKKCRNVSLTWPWRKVLFTLGSLMWRVIVSSFRKVFLFVLVMMSRLLPSPATKWIVWFIRRIWRKCVFSLIKHWREKKPIPVWISVSAMPMENMNGGNTVPLLFPVWREIRYIIY